MTAINIVRRHDAVHVITDGAVYMPDGTLVAANNKATALPHLPAIISVRGPATAQAAFAQYIGFKFRDFDDLVSRIADELPSICFEFEGVFNVCEQPDVELFIAGWSTTRRRGESFMIRSYSEDKGGLLQGDYSGQNVMTGIEAFTLTVLDEASICPGVPNHLLELAGFAATCADQVVPERDGLKLLEAQRHSPMQVAPDFPALHLVGCFAQLSTVSANGVTARILHRWDEDEIGSVISPRPIDWPTWRARVDAAYIATAVPEGLSRLQRERLQKKAKKGTLRVVG